ncbi:MAG: DPP IV N-terminal domain-containing protein [Xanthomonadales bacterium]|nr:DPP IV N-terminal domain-containing protein [Xanthomonadales bacterium]
MPNHAILRLSAGLLLAATVGLAPAADKPSLTLDSIFSSGDFVSQTLDNVQWSDDGSRFAFLKAEPGTGRTVIYEHDVASGQERIIVPASALQFGGEPIEVTAFRFSADRRYLLLDGPRTRTWDNYRQGPHYVFDARDGTVTALAGGNDTLRNVQLSPAGPHVGWVLDNDLHVTDLESGETVAVTTDGSDNIFNGVFDYGSTEFGFTEAWHWSPDGSRIAFWRLDATDVPVWWMIDELGKYPEIRPLKYPSTGEKHAVNQIGVYDLDEASTTWMDIGDDPDAYIPRIDWARNSDLLAIQRLTRDHDRLDLLLADPDTGRSRAIVTDTDPAWIDITRDLTFFDTAARFVWTSEKSGWRHAYLYDYDGNETQLTDGDWEISSLIAVDEANRWLYFYARKDSLIDQHVYRVSLDGGEVGKLSGDAGWYDWTFSPGRDLVIQTYSNAATPPVITLRHPAGEQVRTLVVNELEGLKKYAVPNPEFFTFKTTDGTELNAYMIRPTDFNPAKKYPVIAFGYGNAATQMVINRWAGPRGMQRDMWHRYMAEQGYLVFSMDNRTTAGRGKQAYNMTYGHYAKWAVHDQVEGSKYLRSLPYIDDERVGFWGWSGGGYLAAALMTKGAPHFQVGVSVAPVIDITGYQAVGVERWMGQLEEHPEGYEAVNLENFADLLQGDLLLIHGSGDENVKFAFTLQFADALIKANRQFDMMVYPNEHHGIEGARLHVYTKIADYFLEKL